LQVSASPTGTSVRPFRANYEVVYKGRSAGVSEFSVTQEGANSEYRFASHTKLRGLAARLVVPHAIVENSRFTVVEGLIRPGEFEYQDGSRKGGDNYGIQFDWAGGQAALAIEDGLREIPLHPGVFDRGSSQVAIMLDAAADRVPARYEIIDDDGLEIYEVSELDPAPAPTGYGAIPSRRFSQQRQGSSRSTVLWLAPSLGFLPARIEQIRNGEAETIFVLDSVEFH
jgi:hypothetical protein